MKKILDIAKKFILFLPSVIKYRREAKRLSQVDYFDYNELLKGKYVTPKFFNAFFLYGNFRAIPKLSHHKVNFVVDYIEHGISYSDELDSVPALGYADRFCVKNIYTFSEERAKVIEQYLHTKNLKKNIVAVGPYILGADHFYSEEKRKELKKKYGRILLVYPAHSIDVLKANYDVQQLLDEVESRSEYFDTVFVCLHWLDILDEDRRRQYTDRGCIIVSNGLGSDPCFISRQKDLISLSDMVMTNSLGTHIGYAVSLNKPVYVYNQKITMTGDTSLRSDTANNTIDVFKKSFGNFSFDITEEQLDLVHKIWGRWE